MYPAHLPLLKGWWHGSTWMGDVEMHALIWQGHVSLFRVGLCLSKAKTVGNARYGDSNSDLPVCLSTGLKEITPSETDRSLV